MSDSTLNRFLSSGTAAERGAFTPDPPTPASGPDPTYIWFETDTGDTYAWDFGGAAWEQVNTAGASPGRLIGRQVITATGAGTYTPTAGTASIVIQMVGAGGGGAGVAQPTGSNGSRGASGGGGAYLEKRLTADFSGASYSVGAKGTGGSAGLNNGNNGGNTTFTDTAGSPTTYTAGGGTGGAALAAAAAASVADRTAGGTATNGDINVAGGYAPPGIVIGSTGGGFSGAGGASHLSPGAPPIRLNTANSSVAGANAGGYGGGGSAAYAQGTGAAQAGGDGSDGIIIIWEYS